MYSLYMKENLHLFQVLHERVEVYVCDDGHRTTKKDFKCVQSVHTSNYGDVISGNRKFISFLLPN